MLQPLAIIVFATALALPAWAAVTLQPVEDSFTSSANPTNNYGGAGLVTVSSSALSKGGFSGVVMYDFASTKASLDSQYGVGGWTVQSITLTMTFTSPNNPLFNSPAAAGNFNATWFDGSWVESNGTPTAPSSTGINNNTLGTFLAGTTSALGTYAFDGSTSGTQTISFALSPDLVADLTNGTKGSVAFTAADNTGSFNMLFDSRSFGGGSAQPTLSIAVTPEPTRAALLMVGLVLVAGRRRQLRL